MEDSSDPIKRASGFSGLIKIIELKQLCHYSDSSLVLLGAEYLSYLPSGYRGARLRRYGLHNLTIEEINFIVFSEIDRYLNYGRISTMFCHGM